VADVCRRCRDGQHDHDRHTGTLPGTTPGADAGCPYAVNGGDQCACTVIVDRTGKPVTPKVGPGQPPNPRDEPIANAIWFALVRVRDAFDWADVARDVEEQLRRQGIVTPAHDRLREAEREREALRVQCNSLRAQWAAREAREARRG
jgi:hypothetical protein